MVNTKTILNRFRQALYNFNKTELRKSISKTFHNDALLQYGHPLETLNNREELITRIYEPLAEAFWGLERRDYILMQGKCAGSEDKEGQTSSSWIGCCGYYTGTFIKPWLGIPPSGHMAALRFHEFYRVTGNKIIEVQALFDIPALMMQAGVWPMTPSLGLEWQVPSPATQDGLSIQICDDEHSQRSCNLVMDMCRDLGNYAQGGVSAMNLEKYWHPHLSWYGPGGIGTGRGIEGFRKWHQIPFLAGMPDRVGDTEGGYLFAEGDYVGFTAWPGMYMTISDDGWLGIPPIHKPISMRSLDFWRCENGLIKENWVLIDLLHIYHQIDVDVLHRMGEIAYSRRRN